MNNDLIKKTTDMQVSESKNDTKTFRTVHYLGSKLRILNFIKDIVDEIDPKKGGVCDLFAGSGAVSQHIARERKVTSVDIQKYSSTICSALLNPIKHIPLDSFILPAERSKKTREYSDLFRPLILLEEETINEGDPDSICSFLENASLYAAINGDLRKTPKKLKEAFLKTLSNIKKFPPQSFLATKYFGGVYFSYRQAVEIDSLIDSILKIDSKYNNIFLASILSTASDIVNTVGKQFAQPIRPRDKNGIPKKALKKQLLKDRNIDVSSRFESWINKYTSNTVCNKNHQTLCMDYKEALNCLDEETSIVYADPPYTRDHYSRFYHGLETLCKQDYPKISSTMIGGEFKLTRGLYRNERHQSDFCIRSKAPKAFEELFKKVSSLGKTLLLSYSPYDKNKSSHPRVVDMKLLKKLALNHFKSVEIRSPGKFAHNKLNHTKHHLPAEEIAEVLIICRN